MKNLDGYEYQDYGDKDLWAGEGDAPHLGTSLAQDGVKAGIALHCKTWNAEHCSGGPALSQGPPGLYYWLAGGEGRSCSSMSLHSHQSQGGHIHPSDSHVCESTLKRMRQ
jgi:hypothetical protein